jgi:hypothetical protein
MTSSPPQHGLAARAALWVVLAVVLVHSAAIALWVAPTNLLRHTIGPDRLSGYILPMFDQAWSVFAPEADSQYDLFELRATLRGADGRETVTPWRPVTEREVVASLRYHPFPSRTALMSTRLGGHLQKAFNDLSQRQRDIVAASGRDVSVDEVGRRLTAAAADDVERLHVTTYLRTEVATEYFLSGMADAIWGEGVVAVQFRKYRIIATQYTNQQGSRQRRLPVELVSNWRAPHDLTEADRDAFSGYAAEFGIR